MSLAEVLRELGWRIPILEPAPPEELPTRPVLSDSFQVKFEVAGDVLKVSVYLPLSPIQEALAPHRSDQK